MGNTFSDDGVVNVPLMMGMFIVIMILGGVVISGAYKYISDHEIVTDMRILIGCALELLFNFLYRPVLAQVWLLLSQIIRY